MKERRDLLTVGRREDARAESDEGEISHRPPVVLANRRRMTLEEAYQRFAPSAKRLAYLVTRDKDSAEDLAQEAFIRVAGRMHHLRHPDSFWPYLRATVVHLAVSRHRHSRVEQSKLPLLRSQDDQGSAGAGLIEGVADRAYLLETIAKLPPKQRAAVVLRYYEDLDAVQIAHELGTSPGTVRSWLSRALVELRALIPETEREDE